MAKKKSNWRKKHRTHVYDVVYGTRQSVSCTMIDIQHWAKCDGILHSCMESYKTLIWPFPKIWLNAYTVFDLISESALISGHPPFFVKKIKLIFLLFVIFYFFILILIIISSDFREGNTSLLYTGLMATHALTLKIHLLGQNLKQR